LGRYINASENKDKFGIWSEGKRTDWIDEDILKDESNEYFSDYQQILNFDDNFNEDDFVEEKIVQDLNN
jgi:hypothetical protein